MKILRLWPVVATLLCWLAVSAGARAAELVMFDAPFCEWCERWDEEVGVIYHKTDEGRRAPLRRLALSAPRPDDLESIEGLRYTPTFVLLDQGREIGRILGYPGEANFWGLLGQLLQSIDRTVNTPLY